MVYKKYVWKNGIRHGPYYYESYRDGNSVKKRYLGTSLPSPKKENNWNFKIYLQIGLILLGVLFLFYLVTIGVRPQGRLVLDYEPSYEIGDILKGSLTLNLKSGELIPSDSVLEVDLNEQRKEILLSDLVFENISSGDFFAEGLELNGSGRGFGVSGKREIYPDVEFQLLISEISGEETADEEGSAIEEEIIDENEFEEDVSEEDGEVIEEVDVEEEDASEENEMEEKIADGNEEDAIEEVGEEPAEEETFSEESPADETAADITGEVAAGGGVLVSGIVSKEKEFVYDLAEGQSAEIVSGSVEVDGEKIEDGEIDLTLSDGEAVVSTDYSVIEEGFGENYLGDYELELEIDVSDFNISAELGDLSVNLIYDGQILASESETIIVEGAELAAESNLSFTGGIGMIRIPFGGFAEINLSDYFINAEEYLLNCSNITGVVSSDVMTLTPDAGFRGARLCKISGYLDENLVESNEFNVLVSSGAFNVLTSHSRIKVGEPVKWKANVSLEVVESVIVELPGEAENISVRKIEGGEEKETAVSINAGVVIDVQKSNKNLIDYIFELFGTITGRTVSENESAQGTIEVGLNDNATEYVIEYITEAPVAVESETGFGKEVVISGPDELNYTDVLAFASINEIFEVGQEGKIKIYWHNYDYNESAAGFEEINFIYTKNNKKEGFERNDEPSRINNFPSPEFNNKDSSKYLNVSDKENKKGSSPYSSLDFEVNNYNSEVKTLAPGAANSFITGNVIDGGVIRTDSEGRNYRLQEIAFDAYDLDSNGKLDYVEWIVPHLSNQTFEIILIIKAEHLDANRTFVEDVYSLVSIRDYNYSLITVGDYLRVTFEQNLTSQKDITIYGKSSGVASVEVYEKDENDLIARFENVSEDKEYKIYLNDLNGSQDTFDLLVVGEDVEFDYVVDPSITIVSPENITYTLLPLYFNVSVSEDATVNYTLDGGITNISMSSIDNRSFNATNESIADGGYNFTAYVFQGGTLYIRSVVFSVDVNFPPNQPSLISPLNLSTGNSLTPILNVSVTDNDNDAMNVTFWNKFVSMDAGYEHTCGIIANGSAMCWGANGQGQVGCGDSNLNTSNPTYVNATNTFVSISAGEWHTCGIISNGSAMCWGGNDFRQIEDGTTTTPIRSPVFVNTTNKFISIDAGNIYTCGIISNGSAMCWGSNLEGEIGDGTSGASKLNPVFVNTTNTFVSISAYGGHTCGIISNGSAMCWGYNNHGQIGDGTNGTDRLNPVFVNTTNSFISIDSGDWHSCGLLSNGSAMCWGYNNYGQIGDGTNGTDRLNPVFVNTTNKFVSIDAGDWHSCGLLANGSAMCWGANDFGKIGDGTTTTPRVNPVFVNTTNTFVSVSAGGRHSCGIISNGSAMCWGYNGFGGIGDGTTTTQRVNPVFVNTTNMFSSSVIGNSTNIANGSSTFVNWTNLSLTSSLGLSYSSTYLWRVSADDGNGNLANSPIWQFTTLDANDTTAPIITINLPANDSNFNISSIGFNVSINENASWCGLSISGLANETMTLNATGTGANYTNSSIADGSYTFVVSCNDTANNYGTSSSYNFLVDTLYPSINFTGETPASGSNQTATSIIVNVSSNDTNQHYVVTNFDDSLVGWWRLDNNGPGENSTKVYDWSGRGNNGTVVIVDSSRIGPVTNGKFGGGFEFSGLANVINVNISEQSLTDSSSFAYSAWIKRAVDDTTEDEVINNGNRQIYVTGRKVVAYMEGNHLTGATTLQSETWYHVAFTYEHSTQIQTLYLNGILDGTSNNSVLSGIASDFYIGRCQYSAHEHEFNGTIDEVIVFNRSLSSSEILALYNASATKYYNNFTGLSVGNHTFKSYAIDLAGNLNSTEERNVTIYSRPVVTLVSPNASSTTTDRTPTFNWTGSDADGDQISYEFNISLIAGGGSTCVDSIARGVKLAGTNYTLPLDLGCLYDNGNVYNWSVRANDSIGYGVWASRLINISSSIAITMVNGSINFGSLIPNVSVNTTDASYAPFVVENRGNSLINISVLSNVLWTTESSASKYFQFKADNYTGHEGAFSWASSSIAWRNMSTSAQTCVSNLNYTALNRSEVDILLWVSPGELVSNKSFTITFTASLSEGA